MHGSLQFPPHFIFGAATASYQIEGAVRSGGRGPSIWDTFSHTPGKVLHGDTGDVACDHYNRLEEDLDLLQRYHLDAYRFSIAWPRIQPQGSGAANQLGVDFYDRLIDGLMQRGIQPVATLYHWDLPQRLQDEGGWTHRATAERFAEYAAICGDAFGDRVNTWITLNEPWCSAFLGHAVGTHAPGIVDPLAALQATHTLNLAHGKALQALRGTVTNQQAQFSVTHNLYTVRPASDSDADAHAAHEVATLYNEIFLGPQLEGRLPELLVAITREITDWSFIEDGDLATIRQPLDVLGLNWYTPLWVRRIEPGRSPDEPSTLVGLSHVAASEPEGLSRTDMGWPIDASGLYDILRELGNEYPDLPIVITENGAAYDDPVIQGRVSDPRRIEYLQQHLAACHQALSDGVDLRGYFVWSLMDNFEWALGYDRRFGITHVDFDTQVRTPRDSAWFFAGLAKDKSLTIQSR